MVQERSEISLLMERLIADSSLDDIFWVPKANVFIQCRNPLSTATAENSLKTRMYTHLVHDALEEHAYDAQLTGLKYSVSICPVGLEIRVSGYNDSLPVSTLR